MLNFSFCYTMQNGCPLESGRCARCLRRTMHVTGSSQSRASYLPVASLATKMCTLSVVEITKREDFSVIFLRVIELEAIWHAHGLSALVALHRSVLFPLTHTCLL